MLLLAAAREELGELAGEAVGLGPVVSASRAASIVGQRAPEAVVLVGTAGAYPGGPPIGAAVASRRVGLSWGVAVMGLGYVPRPPRAVEAAAEMLDLLDLPRHDVLTVGAVTTDLTLAERLADGWTVEHLEAFGVAYACQRHGVPFVAVLGIANQVGPDAHAQWLMNREAAREAARRAITRLLGPTLG